MRRSIRASPLSDTAVDLGAIANELGCSTSQARIGLVYNKDAKVDRDSAVRHAPFLAENLAAQIRLTAKR